MGAVRAEAARQLGASVTGLLDPAREPAEALSTCHPGSRVLDAAADIDWDEFDAAFVCTPPGSRGLELEAVRAGVPVLVEKPLSVSAELARELVVAAREGHARTAVGYMNRYRPGVQHLRARIGRSPPFAIACHWVSSGYNKPWWADPAESGGPLNDLSTHLIDLCRFIAGEIDAVCALSLIHI